MLKIPVTIYPHKVKGVAYGTMVLVPSRVNLTREEVHSPQFYGTYTDQNGVHVVLTVKLPKPLDNTLDLEASGVFSGVEWRGECWAEHYGTAGLRFYLGKRSPAVLLTLGRHTARVWMSQFKGWKAYALDIHV